MIIIIYYICYDWLLFIIIIYQLSMFSQEIHSTESKKFKLFEFKESHN